MTRPSAPIRTTALLGLSWLGVACASSVPPSPGPRAAANDAGRGFRRSVDAIPVADEAGNAYEFPFLGGFNVPRPQWVDIDADGDLDIFIQETTNRLLFFEQTGTAAEPQLTWRPDLFQDLEVGEWFRFVDVDRDGDPDLLAEEPFSYMRLYRNEGSPSQPAFTLAADTLRDTSGEAIFSDRQNIPNAADIDCDDLLDLFIGRLVGTVTRYEATGEVAENLAPFRHVTDDFENIEIVATFGTLHGANTMALADVDADGDVDMFWGDFFEAGLLFIENTGTCSVPNFRNEPLPFPLDDPIRTSGYNAPAFGDADGDGDLDLLLGVLGGAYNANRTTADNLLHFEQADGRFQLRSSRYISQIDVGSESYPSLVDLDGDGDLDLLLANKIDPDDLNTSVVYRFENVGDPTRPRFRLRGPVEIGAAYHNAPAFGDLDADGDADLILGTWRKYLEYFRNDGTPSDARFVRADSAVVVLTRGSNSTPALVDIDSDGDLDLFVGESSGALNFYRNEGTAAAPRFELVSDEYLGIDVGRRSVPTFLDIEGDGDQDLVLGSETGGLLFYRNDGTSREPRFVEAQAPFPGAERLPTFAVPAFADIDADGDLDLFVGGDGGGLYFFENVGR